MRCPQNSFNINILLFSVKTHTDVIFTTWIGQLFFFFNFRRQGLFLLKQHSGDLQKVKKKAQAFWDVSTGSGTEKNFSTQS